jgi:hypothetical protein
MRFSGRDAHLSTKRGGSKRTAILATMRQSAASLKYMRHIVVGFMEDLSAE